ncbi:IS4 family transposase, partial [Bariatricus sp. SGI.154]|uniref:IS4 family transposase n=1 Tax=Bariatricus sp. SGI.154 TaxID=3420549 RepID=UPI003D01FB06
EGFPTVSSFVQQRKKLRFSALEFLFHQFNDRVRSELRLFKNYRLLAIDGSNLSIPYNPEENNCNEEKQVSTMHLDGLFDVMNKIFVDVIVETGSQKDETGTGCKLVDRIKDTYPVIVIADRNYENYNFFAHVEENLYDYVVRIKDRNSTGILSGMKLPDQEEFDITRRVFITRQHSLSTKLMAEKYKYISQKKRFDFSGTDEDSGYEMTIRLVRFQLTEDTYECLATSLPEDLFSIEDLKEIYRRRWGIETGFRELKYVLGIIAFHSKQENSILQEVFARVVMYNFSMLIANRVEPKEKDLKYKLQVNYTQAVRISQNFFRHLDSEVLYDIEKTIQRFLLPVRPNRKNQRTTPGKDAVPFNYRLA